jgi:hypothetical protein
MDDVLYQLANSQYGTWHIVVNNDKKRLARILARREWIGSTARRSSISLFSVTDTVQQISGDME